MADMPATPKPDRILMRVVTPGRPFFHLVKGDPGLSVFDPSAVEPRLSLEEVLNSFRPSSEIVVCPIAALQVLGLRLMAILGDPKLPHRLQEAHAEIVSGPGMTRTEFKQALRRLESYVTEEFASDDRPLESD